MITKSSPAHRISKTMGSYQLIGGTSYTASQSYDVGSSTITYGEGPKYIGYRCNWKPCVQETVKGVSGSLGTWNYFVTTQEHGAAPTQWSLNMLPDRPSTSSGALPATDSVLAEAWAKVHDNLDLNCRESVLLYSGVIQAVPLVGGAFRFVSVMNKAARKFSKSFKKQPFTTVVKAAISGDFINRFVIKPTLDDAYRFLDASNYVLRIMDTMYKRNGPLPTAIRQTASSVEKDSSSSFTADVPFSASMFREPYGTPYVRGTRWYETSAQATAFLLAELSYNTSAVSPIKLWANRCGVTRPLDSVWDLVPFSFVIDYFTRAGDFISGLGDAMSDLDGLRGTIRRIHGAWATTKSFRGYVYRGESASATLKTSYHPIFGPINTFVPSDFRSGSYRFDRHTDNPWSHPFTEPSGLVRLDLSSTRLRTLLELIIQAKL